MAETSKTVTPQDYQGFLAMLNHEGSATILNSLKKGDTNDAMGQIASLTDVWLNRAAARGTTPLEEMNRKNQISYWNPSEINGKASSLDPRIKGLFDAYLQYRVNADQGINPDASFYLNRNYMLQNPGEGQSWHKWFDNGSVRDAYGDPAANGQHLFVASTDYKVPSMFKVSLGGGLTLNPTEDAAQTFAGFQNAKTLYPNTVGHVPTDGPPARPTDGSYGIAPRPNDPSLLDDFSDAITRGLEGVGRGIRDTFNPPSAVPDYAGFDATDAPARWTGEGDMLSPPLTGPAPGDYDFAGGRNFAGNAGYGLFGSGLNGSGISPNAPTDYGFAGGFAPGMAGQLPAGFDGAAYLRANGDVAAAGMNPAMHYLNFGRQEGRAFSPDAWAQTLGPPAGTPTFGPTGTPTIGSGSTASTIGAPPAFNASNYLAANADLQAFGFSPERAAQHFQEFGQFEARALGPGQEARVYSAPGATPTFGPAGTASTIGNPFATPTLGGGSTASTIGAPAASGALPAFFSPRDYVSANPDLAGMSDQQAIDHFQTYGRNEVRALAPWLQAQVYGAPAGTPTQGPGGLSPIYQPPQPTQTVGPGGSVDVMSSGLVPTQMPPDLTSTFGPGPTITARTGTFNGDEYLRANADVAASGQSALDHFRNYGYREGRAIDTLGNHFNGDAYLAANRDVAMAGLNPLEHFLRYGAQEARTLAPSDWAFPLSATTNAGTYGAPAATQTLGPSGMTSTYGAPDPTLTIGPPALTGTYGPPIATPTQGPGNTVPSWSPFGGAGIGNPFGFSGANVGGGLGAGPQSFGSLWPVGSGVGEPAPAADPGGGGLGPFDFTNANVGGFDVNALGGGGGGGTSGPNSVNEMGISGGFDSEGAMRRVLEQQAADIRKADQAAKTVMHSDPNAFNVAIANGGNTVGMGTALQTPGAIGGPVVPNLTVRNYATSAPGAMFSMFAPWR